MSAGRRCAAVTAIVALASWLGGCGGGGSAPPPTGPRAPSTPPPAIALPDPVDYDAVGPGRLCFERSSPVIGEAGMFVIDGSARHAWGFAQTADFTGGLFGEPAISPDGLRIAYSSLTDSRTFWDIYEMPADGGFPIVRVTSPENDFLPAWTPGSVLIWTDANGPFMTTREAVSVTGTRVIATLDQPAGLWVRVGSEYRLLVGAGVDERLDAPAFAPDGSELAWIRSRQSGTEYVRMDVIVGAADGRRAETLISLPLVGGLLRVGRNSQSLAWSLDGRRLAFNYPTSNVLASVFLAERRDGRLTRITSKAGVGDFSVSWSMLPRP